MTSLSKSIWAERRMGEMLQEQEMYKGGGDSSTGSRVRLVQASPTLADVGITKSMSSRAQKIASVPEEEFETVIEEHKHAEKE